MSSMKRSTMFGLAAVSAAPPRLASNARHMQTINRMAERIVFTSRLELLSSCFAEQGERSFDEQFSRAGLQRGIRDFVAALGIGGSRGNVDGFDAVCELDD